MLRSIQKLLKTQPNHTTASAYGDTLSSCTNQKLTAETQQQHRSASRREWLQKQQQNVPPAALGGGG
jgi:hypothetical protein